MVGSLFLYQTRVVRSRRPVMIRSAVPGTSKYSVGGRNSLHTEYSVPCLRLLVTPDLELLDTRSQHQQQQHLRLLLPRVAAEPATKRLRKSCV